jgi:hypothetical protein
MNIRKFVFVSLALAGSLGAGLAQARPDVQWAVSIPGPVGVTISNHSVQLYAPPLMVAAPVYVQPGFRPMRDSDRDGIPDRYDRVYNPRWDRDGDGIPNRYDRYDNRRNDRRDDRRDDHRDPRGWGR